MVCGLRKRVYGHLLGVNFGLRCEKHILENQRVQWFTDNKKVCSIVKKGFNEARFAKIVVGYIPISQQI